MHSFISEIKAVFVKYKAILSARITAFISAVKVAYSNLTKKLSKEKVSKK